MDFVDSTRVRFLLCIWSLLLVHTTCKQEGFVSIECCAESPNTEPTTNINWISDDDFYLIQGRCLPVALPVSNDKSYKRARIFDSDYGNKWCYNLTTINGHDYLIRGTFLHGPSLRTSPDTFFDVSIGTTTIGQVNSSIDAFEVESIFRATNRNVDFCLVRGRGSPFLSKLELRPLDDSHYLNGDPSVILRLVTRVNLGSNELIRYPVDSSDRIWTVNANVKEINSTISIYGANSSVPLEVLQTAVTNTKQLQFLHNDLQASHQDYVVFLYFAELDPSVKMGQRVFDIYVNGEKQYGNFDILQNSSISNYREIVLKVNADGVLNISLIKNSTDVVGLDPICNAYEIFQTHKRVAGTLQQDVDAIVQVRDRLLWENPNNSVLESWSGDPCVPSPWSGLSCGGGPSSGTSSLAITKLDLSSESLQGPVPTEISQLKELKKINLQNNDFTGSIPESFSILQHLTDLSFGCNPQLSKQLPPGLLNQSNLSTESGDCDDQGSVRMQAQRSSTVFIGTITGGSILVTVALGAIFTCCYRRARRPAATKASTKNAVFSIPSMDDIEVKPICIQVYSLRCIESATNMYKTMIGEGGFGAVYRGTLPHGQEVAVKVRSATSTQGTREFENEVSFHIFV